MVPRMELRQLRYFVAVAEEGNISRAAKKIFLTQPALSRQIKALEDEIGLCLLERQAHSIRLTKTGEALLVEARELLRHTDQVLDRVRAASRGVRLRVGYAPSLAAGILSVAVENFTQAHQNARIELLDLSTHDMLDGLQRGGLDVIIGVEQQQETRGIKWTPILRAPWRLAVNQNHPLAKRPQVTPGEISREPLLVYNRRDYPEYWAAVSNWMDETRQRPQVAGEYDGANSLMSAVESGLGLALVITRPDIPVPKRVRLRPLSAPPPPICIAAGCLETRAGDKPLAVFVEELRKAGAE